MAADEADRSAERLSEFALASQLQQAPSVPPRSHTHTGRVTV